MIDKANTELEVELFSCYSMPLVNFLLRDKGFRYLIVGLNPNTKRKFFTFLKTEALGDALKEWAISKPDEKTYPRKQNNNND